MNNKKVIILGDSIAKGVVYSEDKRRYTILEDNCVKRLTRDTGVDITNLSSMGRTCADAFKTLERAELDKDTIVVLEYGGNDSDMPWKEVSQAPDSEHSARVPLPIFTQNMAALIERVRETGAQPVLTTPLPVDAERYFAWVSRSLDPHAILSWLGDVQHIYRWQERYDIAVRQIAAELGVKLFDIRTRFLMERSIGDFMSIDGIHPNAEGHRIIKETALDYLAGAM